MNECLNIHLNKLKIAKARLLAIIDKPKKKNGQGNAVVILELKRSKMPAFTNFKKIENLNVDYSDEIIIENESIFKITDFLQKIMRNYMLKSMLFSIEKTKNREDEERIEYFQSFSTVTGKLTNTKMIEIDILKREIEEICIQKKGKLYNFNY